MLANEYPWHDALDVVKDSIMEARFETEISAEYATALMMSLTGWTYGYHLEDGGFWTVDIVVDENEDPIRCEGKFTVGRPS